jgi:hypothetical protein
MPIDGFSFNGIGEPPPLHSGEGAYPNYFGLRRLGAALGRDGRSFCQCDNEVVVACLRLRTSKDKNIMHLLRCLVFIEATHKCFIHPTYIDTKANHLADNSYSQLKPNLQYLANLLLPLFTQQTHQCSSKSTISARTACCLDLATIVLVVQ